MSQYKPISEWIAEGVNPVGYVDDCGRAVTRVVLADDGNYANLGSTSMLSLARPVAPPAQKRVSDEELLEQFEGTLHLGRCAVSLEAINETRKERAALRSQILQRMKGPTRGEVEKKLYGLVKAYAYASGRDDYTKARTTFLSMFPEGE
jgi:hypothetical protein